MTIVEFLEARLGEDEEVARDAAGWDSSGLIRDEGLWCRDGVNSVIDSARRMVVYGDGSAPDDSKADHIARFDPARTLREVAAKRAILAQEEAARSQFEHVKSSTTYPAIEVLIGQVAALATVIRHLASAYSDHPDYQAEWADQ